MTFSKAIFEVMKRMPAIRKRIKITLTDPKTETSFPAISANASWALEWWLLIMHLYILLAKPNTADPEKHWEGFQRRQEDSRNFTYSTFMGIFLKK